MDLTILLFFPLFIDSLLHPNVKQSCHFKIKHQLLFLYSLSAINTITAIVLVLPELNITVIFESTFEETTSMISRSNKDMLHKKQRKELHLSQLMNLKRDVSGFEF